MRKILCTPKYILPLALVGLVGCNKSTPVVEGAPKADAVVATPSPAAEVAATPEPAPEVPVVAAEPTPEAPVVDAAASYAVAEWGVLVYAGGGEGELVSAPAPAAVPAPVVPPPAVDVPVAPPDAPIARKPVLYLRPGAAWEATTEVAVTVTMTGGGRLHEVWPTAENGAQPTHGASFSWHIKGITSAACEAGWGPKVSDAPCSSLTRPEACEAAEFEAWVPTSAVCLDVSGIPAPALLYNGFPDNLKSPLATQADAAGVFKNVSGHALGLVLVRDAETPGLARVYANVAVDGTIKAGDEAVAVVDPVSTVVAELTKQGLTDHEAADFMRAWAPLLNNADGWTVFGFLDGAAIEAVSTLAFEPKPSAVTRVMAFAIEP